MRPPRSAVPNYDLVAGFRFRCLPGCGLCCYTTPAVAPEERGRLIQFDPETPLIETSDRWAQIASRPNGGACHFLRESRCECHAVRPATCGEFPLTVHVGARVQVSVVLSCPGVELSALVRRAEGSPPGTVSTDLQSEVEFVDRELLQAETRGQLRWASQQHRRVARSMRLSGRWESEDEIRTRLRPRLDTLSLGNRPVEDPPEEVPLESLPLFFDPDFGRVAWRPHPGGVEFLSLRETGGIDRHLGVLPPPLRSPLVNEPARKLLKGYLAYLLERDATIGAAYARSVQVGSGTPGQIVAEDLEGIAAQVLRLAALRRALSSDRRGELSLLDVERGIRATDMDILDRPTVGLRL